jgi:hypothetical protein
MNQLTKLFFVALTATLLLGSNDHTSASQQEKANPVRVEEERVVLEITSAGREPFDVPVPKSRTIAALIPVLGSDISAVRIIPWIEGGLVNIEVSALYGDLSHITTCEQLRALRTESVGSYHAVKGSVIVLSELMGFGVQPFDVHVVSVNAKAEDNQSTSGSSLDSDGDFDAKPNCCTCHSLACCPSQGHCLGCGECGVCCML